MQLHLHPSSCSLLISEYDVAYQLFWWSLTPDVQFRQYRIRLQHFGESFCSPTIHGNSCYKETNEKNELKKLKKKKKSQQPRPRSVRELFSAKDSAIDKTPEFPKLLSIHLFMSFPPSSPRINSKSEYPIKQPRYKVFKLELFLKLFAIAIAPGVPILLSVKYYYLKECHHSVLDWLTFQVKRL